jgi:hypothetical protein
MLNTSCFTHVSRSTASSRLINDALNLKLEPKQEKCRILVLWWLVVD